MIRGDKYICGIPSECGGTQLDVIQTLKNLYHKQGIVILPKDDRHNAAFTEKLQEFEEGNFVVKTIAELKAMEHE